MDKCTRQGVGVDISDRSCEIAVLDAEGNELETAKVATTKEAIRRYFEKVGPSRVAMEVGTHSPWMSRIVEELGHEVYVANARKLRAIWDSDFKSDRTDARLLAEISKCDVVCANCHRMLTYNRSLKAQQRVG